MSKHTSARDIYNALYLIHHELVDMEDTAAKLKLKRAWKKAERSLSAAMDDVGDFEDAVIAKAEGKNK
jgi:hypothetical protein